MIIAADAPVSMTPPRLTVAGNSHVVTVFEGYKLIRGQLPEALELSFIAQGQHRIGHAVGSRTGFEMGQASGTLVELVTGSDATHLFLIWEGSQVTVHGLLLEGPRFDVILPADRDRVADPGVELIPCSAVESQVRAPLDRDEQLSELIDRGIEGGARVWLMAPPPPLPEPAVRQRLGSEPHFAARLGELGLAAADVPVVAEAVRVRLHTLLLGVYRQFAADRGAEFCPPPARVADRAGLLLPACWGKDITHGSAAYGAAYLEELLAVVEGNDA